jgi:16S rRNA (guanine1207-N2)-methyltransferase
VYHCVCDKTRYSKNVKDWQQVLEHYHHIHLKNVGSGLRFATKPGVRDFPDVPAGVLELLKYLEPASGTADIAIDASHSQGLLAQALLQAGYAQVWQAETARAALIASHAVLPDQVHQVAQGLWELPEASVDAVYLMPEASKGSRRVEAELVGAFRVLKVGGTLQVAFAKDQGAKRYEKAATQLFGAGDVRNKKAAFRVSRWQKKSHDGATLCEKTASITFDVAGLTLTAAPGVFAAGKLDKGSELLLEVLTHEGLLTGAALTGQRALDVGCGYGVLALKLALSGAAVTALDDDVLAVKSTAANAAHYGLDVRCLHADVGSSLRDERFDMVVMNPPFHVGKQVRLDVPEAFLATARERLEPSGTLYLVANAALDYESLLNAWGTCHTLRVDKGYKVLKWQPQR